MARARKEGVNWTKIKKQFLSGKSMTLLSRRHDISLSSISQMASREQWVEEREVKTKDNTLQLLVDDQIKSLQTYGKKTPEAQKIIFDGLSIGLSTKLAADSVGIDIRALKRWRADDPEFDQLCHLGVVTFAKQNLHAIHKSVLKGNVNPAQWSLQNNPHTKEEYGQPQNTGNQAIKIELSFKREEILPPDAFKDTTIVNADYEEVDTTSTTVKDDV